MAEKERNYITFEQKQILAISPHRKNVIDTKTNKVMNMYAVRLPSANYRKTEFPKDKAEIDRNTRTAIISIGEPYIRQNQINKDSYYTYLDLDRDYVISFRGHIIGKTDEGKPVYDKPEPLVLKGRDVVKIFDEAREILKQNRAKAKKQKEQKEKESSQEKELVKEKTAEKGIER